MLAWVATHTHIQQNKLTYKVLSHQSLRCHYLLPKGRRCEGTAPKAHIFDSPYSSTEELYILPHITLGGTGKGGPPSCGGHPDREDGMVGSDG